MAILIFAHVLTGLVGIAAGSIAVAGLNCGRRLPQMNAIFLSTTAAACCTGFVFLPTGGITSAQLVAFFVSFLLAVAAYARYFADLNGSWSQVYAFTVVGALFLNVLITVAQSFLHIPALRALAPTQHSPVYVALKLTLLLLFVGVALVTARRVGRS